MSNGQNYGVSPVNLGARSIVEPIVQPLYDSGDMATTTTQIQYFKTPVGQGGKTLVDTNMDTAGQLSNPKLFVISGFRVHATQKLTQAIARATDLASLLHGSFFSFDIGGNFKNYLRIPTFAVPSGFGVTGYADLGTSTAFTGMVTNGMPNIHNYYSIAKYPLGIPPLQSFEATLNFPVALSSIDATTKVWVFLWGVLGREVG